MPPKPKIPLIPQIPQQDGDQVGPQVPLPPGQSDDDYIGKGVQTLLGLVGAGDDQSRWNRFGQLVAAGIPISAPLIAGMKPEMIPYIRESGARMIQDVLENGMPQHLGNGIFDPTTRIPLSPEQAAALQYAQQRFPRLMGHVTGIGAIEPELAGVAGGAYSPQTLNPKFGYIRLNPAYADASTLGHELNHAADSLAIPNASEQYESFNALPGGYAANSHEIRARNAGDTFQRHFDLHQLTEGKFKKLPNKLRKNDPNWDKGNVVPKPVGKPIPINTPNDDEELSKFRNADDFGKPLSKITNMDRPLASTLGPENKFNSLPHFVPEDDDRAKILTKDIFPQASQRKPAVPVKDLQPGGVAQIDPTQVIPTQRIVDREGVRMRLGTPVDSPNVADLPSVYRTPDGKMYVADGHHRFAASILRGDKTTPVRVYNVKE